MTRLFSEYFSGGANGAAVTAANSSFATVPAGWTFDTTVSTLAAAAVTNAAGTLTVTTSNSVVTSTPTWTATATPFARLYLRAEVLPAALSTIFSFRGAGALLAELRLGPSGQVQIRNSSNVQVAVSANGLIPANTDCRFEWSYNNTTGTQQVQVFVGANVNGTVPDYDSGALTTTKAGNCDLVNLGLLNATTATLSFANIQVDNAGWIGPEPPGVILVATAQAANSGNTDVSLVVPAGVTTSHFGVITVATSGSGMAAMTVPTGWTVRVNPKSTQTGTLYMFTRLGGVKAGDTITLTLPSSSGATSSGAWYNTQGRDVAYASAEWDTGVSDVTTVTFPAPGQSVASDVILAAATRTAVANSLPAPTGTVRDFYGTDSSWLGGAFFGHATGVTSQAYTSTWAPSAATSHNTVAMQFAFTPVANPNQPQLVGTYGPGALATTATRTCQVTTQPGDVLVLMASTANSQWFTGTPSGGTGLTWSEAGFISQTGAAGAFIWTAKATTAETFTLSLSASGSATGTNQSWTYQVLRFSNSGGIGAVATASNGGTTPGLAITPQQAGSTIVWMDSDFNGVSGASRAYRTTAGLVYETFYGNITGGVITSYMAYNTGTTTGVQTVGLTAPTGQAPAMVAVEVLPPAAPAAQPPQFIGWTQFGDGLTTNQGTATIPIPSGAQAGDVMVAVLDDQTSTVTLNASDWTILAGPNNASGTMVSYMIGRTLTAADISAGSVSQGISTAGRLVAVAHTYRGVTLSGASVAVQDDASSVSNPVLPSWPNPPAGSVASAFFARRRSGAAGTVTIPAPWTTAGTSASSNGTSTNTYVDGAYQLNLSSSGTVGGETGTSGVSSVGENYVVVLRIATQSYTPNAAESIGISDYPVVTGSMIKAAVAGSTITELTAAQNSSGAITVNTPAGTQPGDLLVFTVAEYAIANWSIADVVPAGWTRVGFAADDYYGPALDAYIMPVRSAPAASYTFPCGAGTAATATLTRITNADLSNPIAQPATLYAPGVSFYGSSVTVPDEPIMQPNVLALTIAGLGSTTATDTIVPPASLTTSVQNTGGGARELVASKFIPAGGNNGLDTWTSSNTGLCWAFIRLYINTAGSSPTQMQTPGIVGTPTVAEGGPGTNSLTATTPAGARAGETLVAFLAHHAQGGPPYYPPGGWIRTGTRATVDKQTIGVDSVSQGAGSSGTTKVTSVSYTHTVTSAAQQRFLVVGVAAGQATVATNPTLSVTVNGTGLAAFGPAVVGASGAAANGNISQTFVMPNPPAGALNIVVTSSVAVVLNAGSICFTGVDQTNSYGNAYGIASASSNPVVANLAAGNMTAGEMIITVGAASQAATGAAAGTTLDVNRSSTTTYVGGNLFIGHAVATGAVQGLTFNMAAAAAVGGTTMSLNPAPASTDVTAFYLPLTAAPDPSYTFFTSDGPATLILARLAGVPISSPLEWPVREDWSTSAASNLVNLNDISSYEANTYHAIVIAQSATGSTETLSGVPSDVSVLAQNSGVGKKLIVGARSVPAANTVMPTTDTYTNTQSTLVWWAFLYLAFRAGPVYQMNYTPTPADAVGITDAVTTAVGDVRAVADAVGITDSVSISITRTISDNIGITDVGSGGAIFAPTAADAEGLTDAVSFAQTQFIARGPDSVGITDSVTYSWGWGPHAADSVGITDAITIVKTQNITVNDNITAVDTGTGGTLFLPTPNDAVGIADATSFVQDAHPAVADAVGITDAVSWALTSFHTVADNIGATDAIALGRGANPADSIGIHDTPSTSTGWVRTAADNIGIADAEFRTFGDNDAQDLVGITDHITTFYVIGRNPTENVGITDAIIISQSNKRTFAENIGVTDASAPFGNLSQVTSTTAQPDVDIEEPNVILEDVANLEATLPVELSVTGNLVKGPQRASFDIGMTGDLTHVAAIAASLDIEIDNTPAAPLLVVARMTDIVTVNNVGVVMPMVLRNGPVYSDPVLGACATGGPQPYLGPTDKPVWRLARNFAVPSGWGAYIAADIFDDIPKGSEITISVWVRANAGDAISFDIVTDPAQFRPAVEFPDNSMVGTGAWRQYTKTFTLTDDWVANFQRFRSVVNTWIEWSDATVQLAVPRALKEQPSPEPAKPEPKKFSRIFTVLR